MGDWFSLTCEYLASPSDTKVYKSVTVEHGTSSSLRRCIRPPAPGATASFDFSGIPPFVVEYTEQRDRHRPVTRTAQFRGYAGDIVLTPEQEGEYTYVSYWMSRAQPASAFEGLEAPR
jgi:hypothetical protein